MRYGGAQMDTSVPGRMDQRCCPPRKWHWILKQELFPQQRGRYSRQMTEA